MAYVGRIHDLQDPKDLGPLCMRARTYFSFTQIPHLGITLQSLAASPLHWRAGSSRSSAAIRKHAGLSCGSFLRKGEVLAYVGSIQNLKDLQDLPQFPRTGQYLGSWGDHVPRSLEATPPWALL